MKNKILTLLLIVTSTLFTTNIYAKGAITKTTIAVAGNCETCKATIEKAAKVKGVKNVNWSEETKMLTVEYAPAKISIDQIQQNIAKAGYDTPKYKAIIEDYNNLPKCCQYDDKK